MPKQKQTKKIARSVPYNDWLIEKLKNHTHGGIAKIAKKAKLGRESLYKTVSEKGNPEFRTIVTLSHAMGFELKFLPER